MDDIEKCGDTITNKVENFDFASNVQEGNKSRKSDDAHNDCLEVNPSAFADVDSALQVTKITNNSVALKLNVVDESHKFDNKKLITDNFPSEKGSNKSLNSKFSIDTHDDHKIECVQGNLNLLRGINSDLLLSDTENVNVFQKCSVNEESNVLQREVDQKNNLVQPAVDQANEIQCAVDEANNVLQCDGNDVQPYDASDNSNFQNCDTSENNNIEVCDVGEDNNVRATDAGGKLQVDNVLHCDVRTACNVGQCNVGEANNMHQCGVGKLNNAQSGDLNEENNTKHISNRKEVSTMCFLKEENTRKIVDYEQEQKKSNTSNNLESIKSHVVSSFILSVHDEATDNENAEWDSVKNLSSDQQRYEHVRKSWGTRKVPNPNKDLTFCSFMKKGLLSKNENFVLAKYREQRKRIATHSPCKKHAKRQKTNVDYFNNKMDLVTKQSLREKHSVCTIFDQQIDTGRWNCFHQMYDLYNQPYFINEQRRRQEIEMMWEYEQNSLLNDRSKHLALINKRRAADLKTLQNIKNEVLKFSQFYQGLVVGEDLTVLTDKQYQELKEIDEMYDAYDKYYN